MSYDIEARNDISKLQKLVATMGQSLAAIAADIETHKARVRAIEDELATLQRQAEDASCFAAAQELANSLQDESTSEGERPIAQPTMPSPSTESTEPTHPNIDF